VKKWISVKANVKHFLETIVFLALKSLTSYLKRFPMFFKSFDLRTRYFSKQRKKVQKYSSKEALAPAVSKIGTHAIRFVSIWQDCLATSAGQLPFFQRFAALAVVGIPTDKHHFSHGR